jgi:hypothetical protein
VEADRPAIVNPVGEEARDAARGNRRDPAGQHGPLQLRLTFGKKPYCVVEIQRGEEVAEVAKKLRDLATQVEARKT